MLNKKKTAPFVHISIISENIVSFKCNHKRTNRGYIEGTTDTNVLFRLVHNVPVTNMEMRQSRQHLRV